MAEAVTGNGGRIGWAPLLVLAIFMLVSAAAWADVGDGIRTFNRGDYGSARGHLDSAAKTGDVRAQWLMGRMAFEGLGMARDDGQAFRWFRAAAANGFVAAQNNVGFMYENGRGVTRDPTQAVQWYRKAADTGHAGAQYNVGRMHDAGLGVPRSPAEAERWYRKAADQGFQPARESLAALKSRPVPESGAGGSSDKAFEKQLGKLQVVINKIGPQQSGTLVQTAPPPAAKVDPPPKAAASAPLKTVPVAIATVDKSPPVIQADDRFEIAAETVSFTGTVTDASIIAQLSVDGRPIPVTANGTFAVKRFVPVGETRLTLVAFDEWGNEAERAVTVVRAAPAASAKEGSRISEGIDFGTYHALVIGNNDYKHLSKLRTAINDAAAVAELLEQDYGFEVTRLINATRNDVLTAIFKYRGALGERDNLLIYYAGHGFLDEDANLGYWLPVDADESVPTNWIEETHITGALTALGAKHVMVVADSCYSGKIVRSASVTLPQSEEQLAWLKRVVTKRARTALTSGGLEPVADGGVGGHSVFAGAFLNALRENQDVLEGQALYTRIKRPVVRDANQTPVYAPVHGTGHDDGDFLFVRR